MDDIRTLMRDAVDDVHADPRLGPAIVQRQRRTQRRLLPLVTVTAAVLLVVGLVGVTVARTRPDAAVPATPPSAPVLPTGPEGPHELGSTEPVPLIGRVYPLGPTTSADGRRALMLVFLVRFPGFPTHVGERVDTCTTRWVPGTPLQEATIENCGGFDPSAEPPVDGPRAVLRSPDDKTSPRFMGLSKKTARAEVKLARTSTWRSYATPEGGDAPVDLRQPVQLLGADDPNAPQLIAVSPAIPTGFRYLGTDSWDATGRQILDTREGNYCGPDPSKPAPPVPPDPCPR